jgi:hypothetical protein
MALPRCIFTRRTSGSLARACRNGVAPWPAGIELPAGGDLPPALPVIPSAEGVAQCCRSAGRFSHRRRPPPQAILSGAFRERCAARSCRTIFHLLGGSPQTRLRSFARLLPASKSWIMRSRPDRPIAIDRSGASRRRSMAAAIACTSCSATRNPVEPCKTASGIPECSVDTTGSSLAIASSIATGIPSESPVSSVTEC